MKTKLASFAVLSAFVVAGCTFPSSHRVVPASQAGVMQNVDTGVVTSVREVTIEGKKTNLGLVGGAVVGGAAMKPSAGNTSQAGALGQAAGAVAGAVAGQAIEESVTRKRAQEISVRLDDGRNIVVTQAVESGLYQDGDRVRILHSNGEARVAMAIN